MPSPNFMEYMSHAVPWVNFVGRGPGVAALEDSRQLYDQELRPQAVLTFCSLSSLSSSKF
jgi:hypothetical protein